MKKIFLIILAGIIGFYSFSLAWNEFTYENAKKIATEYIANSSFDENWWEQNPTLAWEGKYFYTESEKPSYIEFKVSCDKNPDCGFIMVNFDGDDVAIPIASTSGNTPSEVLSAKNESKIEENMLYYFSPFEQYAENKRNGNISSIDPQDDFWYEVSEKNKLSLQEVKTKKNNTLKEKIESSKKEAKTFKKSVEFKEIKKELKEKKQTNGKEEVSFKYLDLALADVDEWNNSYTSPWASNIFIIWSNTPDCWSRTPCYHQYKTTYNWKSAYSWCSPTAMAIIYGYYDRNGKWNLIPWTAASASSTPSNFDPIIKSVIDTLKIQMSWYYIYNSVHDIYEVWVTQSNFKNWIQYAKDKWYSSSTAVTETWDTTTLFSQIKTEINNNRPVVLHLKPSNGQSGGHSVVWYWYKNTWTTPIVRINMWWWYTLLSWTTYYSSNIDYNINSMYYSGNIRYTYWITKININ